MPELPIHIFEDEEFGSVFVYKSDRMSEGRYSFSATDEGLKVKTKSVSSMGDLARVLNEMRPKLRVLVARYNKKKENAPALDFGYVIKAYPYDLILLKGDYTDRFVTKFNREERRVDIYCPANMDFSNDVYIETLRKVCAKALRNVAQTYIPQRVRKLAEKGGFKYTKVGFTDAVGRWGSCSSKGHINISIWTLLLGKELMDSVIVHELCHTVEMNHSERFWMLFERSFGKKRAEVDAEIRKIILPKFVNMK